jgi:hypothetical protein
MDKRSTSWNGSDRKADLDERAAFAPPDADGCDKRPARRRSMQIQDENDVGVFCRLPPREVFEIDRGRATDADFCGADSG